MSRETLPSDIPEPRGTGRGRTVAALAGLIALAATLRVYRLDQQSVWLDDYFPLAHLRAPDLNTLLALVRFYNLDNVPLYYIVQYVWAHVVDPASIVGQRLLPLACGVGCVPLTYLLARDLYGRKAGLIAAFCLALSPVYIWLAQGTRPHALGDLLAITSLYALARATRENALRWWICLFSANLLLVWTYTFDVFVVGTELAYLLLFLRRRPMQTIAVGVAQFLAAASPLLWLRVTLPISLTSKDDFIMTIPSARELLVDFVGDDAILSSDPFSFQGTTWGFLPEPFRLPLRNMHPYFDAALMIVFGAALLWISLRLLAAARRARFDQQALAERDAAAFVVCLAVVPLLTLLVLSYIWRPCILPRYTSFSAFGLYTAVGAAIATRRRGSVRKGALVLLTGLYAYQLSFTLPAATRTDWLSAKRHIQAGAHAGDVALIKGSILAWEVFRMNAPDLGVPLAPAYTLEALCEKSARYLEQPGPPERQVWAVIEPFIFTFPPLERFEDALRSKGLAFTRTEFPGMNGLFVYAIRRDPTLPVSPSPVEIQTKADYPAMLADLGVQPGDQPAYERTRLALRHAVDTEWPLTRFYYCWLSLALSNEGYPDVALTVANRAKALGPDYSFAFLASAVAQGERGDVSAAMADLQAAIAHDPMDVFKLYQDLFRVLYQEPDLPQAQRELLRLDAMGTQIPFVLWARAGLASETAALRCGK